MVIYHSNVCIDVLADYLDVISYFPLREDELERKMRSKSTPAGFISAFKHFGKKYLKANYLVDFSNEVINFLNDFTNGFRKGRKTKECKGDQSVYGPQHGKVDMSLEGMRKYVILALNNFNTEMQATYYHAILTLASASQQRLETAVNLKKSQVSNACISM